MASTKAPGLHWRKRSDGSQIAYWVARHDLVRAGFQPKTVRLHFDPDDPALVTRCQLLQAQMLEWAARSRNGPRAIYATYDGTFASLVRLYETHPESPYFDIKPGTQVGYSKALAALMRHVGTRLVGQVTGADVRRWYKELSEAKSRGWAHYVISVLKIALSFGTTMRLQECQQLRGELSAVRLRAGKRRTVQITYPQVVAFRAAAHELGFGWMALCLTLQFAFGLRRRDVIGEWIKDPGAAAAIVNGDMVWRDGLTWGDIEADGLIHRLVSKTEDTTADVAVHCVHDYPDVMEELRRAGYPRRAGPIVLSHSTGLPPTDSQCRRIFRIVATKAGIPPDVQNRDARAGANTEALSAGASQEEAMGLLTHSRPETNRIYQRDLTELSRSAARKRVAARKE